LVINEKELAFETIFQKHMPAHNMWFAAMAGRRNKYQQSTSISSSFGTTNKSKILVLSSAIKQNRASVLGVTFNEYRHSSKP